MGPTTTVKLRPWNTPNFATIEMPPRPRQEGIREMPSIPVADLEQSALDALAQAWLTELYKKAGKRCPFFTIQVGRE